MHGSPNSRPEHPGRPGLARVPSPEPPYLTVYNECTRLIAPGWHSARRGCPLSKRSSMYTLQTGINARTFLPVCFPFTHYGMWSDYNNRNLPTNRYHIDTQLFATTLSLSCHQSFDFPSLTTLIPPFQFGFIERGTTTCRLTTTSTAFKKRQMLSECLYTIA